MHNLAMRSPSGVDTRPSHQLLGTQRLRLSEGLTAFPEEILELADSIEVLDLSNNALTTLPDSFAQLHNLRVAFFNNNAFEVVPKVLARCPKLSMVGFKSNQITTVPAEALPAATRWLILTDNRLETLPESIGQHSQLQKLMLAGNQLRALPESLAHCQNLELVRLAANQLEVLPPWLLTLPRLSWLAYAGNPFCRTAAIGEPLPLPQIAWDDLTVGEVLGEGASGVISRGTWRQGDQEIPVALKLFKGAITSDGLPEDEMRACIAAGAHPHLIGPLGQIVDHPEQKNGLVLPLVDPSYQVMGGPPSLESCTRDTYPPEATFSLEAAVGIAIGVAGAAAHLHRRGILHGDLYPHNTLVTEAGDTCLSDFGAASFYDRAGRSAPALERLEVRAFGCLLEDLLDRCPASSSPALRLRQLQHACMQPDVLARPAFEEALEDLSGLTP
ncbi:leucine-rich repeat-containing protein kinase family protein [Leptolyngbya sp. CCNP1308]|uniref:leucine-rich repeat-containing protein kinase family protein n=1 Tax=Leptolyngbya sp. CCNP1308 TaxID=3110255 RepID=UPI002B1F3456|nr:leucine-rich repeat-containing protein kinase family protein [Leptolyngbya sp. CCNP1308]MEA5450152.1 leucine-rich repeat-containing protein kinase family protein [Leptolyngbya sp. CCNP1308]